MKASQFTDAQKAFIIKQGEELASDQFVAHASRGLSEADDFLVAFAAESLHSNAVGSNKALGQASGSSPWPGPR